MATDVVPSEKLVSIDRVHAARDVAGELGLDLLVVTPGSDLRYLCGYSAHAMERLTALVDDLPPGAGAAAEQRLDAPDAAAAVRAGLAGGGDLPGRAGTGFRVAPHLFLGHAEAAADEHAGHLPTKSKGRAVPTLRR